MDRLDSLRQLVSSIGSGPVPLGDFGANTLAENGFVHASFRFGDTGLRLVGISRVGIEGLNSLAESYMNEPHYRRQINFEELSKAILDNALGMFEGRDPASISSGDLAGLAETIESVISEGVGDRTLYIPCMIAFGPAAPFQVGPVHFQKVEDFAAVGLAQMPEFQRSSFAEIFADMSARAAQWMATIQVAGCRVKRAWEIGDIAVDIALTGLQLVIPWDQSNRIARVDGRTYPPMRRRASSSNGQFTTESTAQAPGLLLGTGALDAYVQAGSHILGPVGSLVEFYANGAGNLPKLSQAWIDAAYWYHEGLAELLDTVAVPKLETSIEVLLKSENSSRSEARLITAIEVFHSLTADDFINPHSTTTVKKFARRFVRERSRILHGTSSTLNESLGTSRKNLTEIAGDCLRHYAYELDRYRETPAPEDDSKVFLKWIQDSRKLALIASP